MYPSLGTPGIDKSMVPYRGLHSAKQYIKGKPVKFGYKLWILCSSDGYPYNFEIYCGKNESRTNPLRTHVVEKMLSPVTNPSHHVVFFDNFLLAIRCSPILLEKMLELVVQ